MSTRKTNSEYNETNVEILNCNENDEPLDENEMDEGEANDNPVLVDETEVPDHDEGKGKPGKKPRLSNRRSPCWKHFKELKDKPGRAVCIHCQKEMGCDSKNNGTKGLNYHITVCKALTGKQPPNSAQQSLLNFKTSSNVQDGSLVFQKYDEQTVRKALSLMICLDELPYKFVEGVGFRRFISVACPMFKIPSRWTIARDLFQIYEEEKKKLQNYFKVSNQRVCLTTDTWTSNQKVNYMCLTAHFIDSRWKLNKRIINFCPITSHKGEAIGKLIEACLIEWGIDRIYTVTVDNALTNDKACEYLVKTMKKNSIVNGEYLHMRCVAHVLNLIVMEGLKENSSSIRRIRGAVHYIRNSTERFKLFEKCVKYELPESKKLLCLDVKTRWNSTYLMLATAFALKPAFDRYGAQDSQYFEELNLKYGVPTHDDWVVADKFIVFLERFYDLTCMISGQNYVTSNILFREICALETDLQEITLGLDEELANAARKMLEKYDKYWGNVDKMNLNIFFATILDPRFKLSCVEFVITKLHSKEIAKKIVEKVKLAFYDVFEDYKKAYEVSNRTTPLSNDGSSSSRQVVSVVGKKRSRTSTLDDEFEKYEAEKAMNRTQSDLVKYLEDPREPQSSNLDILEWWKVSSSRYPILGNMARDVLAIPITSVASESAFSTGGRILDQFRSSLTPKSVQTLVCVQDWLRGGAGNHGPLNVEEILEEVEKFEKDLEKKIGDLEAAAGSTAY